MVPNARSLFGMLRLFCSVIALVLVTLYIVLAGLTDTLSESVSYSTLFLLAFLSSATFVVPGPSLLGVGVGGAVLNPWAVGLTMGTASTLGELPAFVLAYWNRDDILRVPGARRISVWMEHRRNIVIFALAATPNPLFDVGSMLAAGAAMPLRTFGIVTLTGKIIRFTGAAWAGHLIGKTELAFF